MDSAWGLIGGGLFAVLVTGILAWVFFRLARKEAREQAARKAKQPPDAPE